MKLKKFMLSEMASYDANLGFEEMVQFYQKANDREIAKMESLIKREDWSGFKKLIQQVTGVKLK
jgi:enolase